MAFVNDEVVEVGLQPVRRPALFGGPSAGPARHRKPARRHASHHAHRVDQDAAVRCDRGLHDRAAFPRVLPQQLAVRRRNTDCTGCAQHQDLPNAVKGHQLW